MRLIVGHLAVRRMVVGVGDGLILIGAGVRSGWRERRGARLEEFVIDDRLHGRICGGCVGAVAAVHHVGRRAGRRGRVHVGGRHLIRVHLRRIVVLVGVAVVVPLALVRHRAVSAAALHLVVVAVVAGRVRHTVLLVGIVVRSVVSSLQAKRTRYM